MIDELYEIINRHVIVVKPKQPLLDWINALYPDLIEDGTETRVYLVKERQSFEDTEKWLRRNFNKIFENELLSRHTGDEDWPQKRTFTLFATWFDTEIHTYAYDIEQSPIEHY